MGVRLLTEVPLAGFIATDLQMGDRVVLDAYGYDDRPVLHFSRNNRSLHIALGQTTIPLPRVDEVEFRLLSVAVVILVESLAKVTLRAVRRAERSFTWEVGS